MDTPKLAVSVLFVFPFISILCFFNKFDLSSLVSLFFEINQLVNRRNAILLFHAILLYIVKESGLLDLSSPSMNESSAYRERRVVTLEKKHQFEVKEVRLEREEEMRGSCIGASLDIVVWEKTEEIERNGEEEMEKELVEVIESEEEVERNGEEELEEVSEVMESVEVIECNEEEKLEEESVEELNRKIEEFITKIKMEIKRVSV